MSLFANMLGKLRFLACGVTSWIEGVQNQAPLPLWTYDPLSYLEKKRVLVSFSVCSGLLGLLC